MWSWFGGGASQKRKDAPKNAILALRQQLDMLQKREKHLESQMAEQDAVARKNVSSNKTGMSTPSRGTEHGSYVPSIRSYWISDIGCFFFFFFANIAAKSALRRKKVHERSLEQTNAQIATIEQQIYSIESANINHETLNAMKNAGSAMKNIHGGMTIDKVDETMYVNSPLYVLSPC